MSRISAAALAVPLCFAFHATCQANDLFQVFLDINLAYYDVIDAGRDLDAMAAELSDLRTDLDVTYFDQFQNRPYFGHPRITDLNNLFAEGDYYNNVADLMISLAQSELNEALAYVYEAFDLLWMKGDCEGAVSALSDARASLSYANDATEFGYEFMKMVPGVMDRIENFVWGSE